MEHDPKCERDWVLNRLAGSMGITVVERERLLREDPVRSLSCFCRERALKTLESGSENGLDLINATRTKLVAWRRNRGVSGRDAARMVAQKMGVEVEGRVIRVDFKNRRRIR